MKKIIALCMLLVFSVIFLAGCSDEAEDQASSDEPLVVWAMGAEGDALPKMMDGFTEETGIEVEVVPIPWDQAHDKLLTSVASQEGPDVVLMPNQWIAEFTEAGAIADMSGYTAEYPEAFSPETYFAACEQFMFYNDELVAVPCYVEARALYYRTDLLAEVGYTEPPATWDELYDCATKLVEQGVAQYGIYFDRFDPQLYMMYAWTYGWTYFDENGDLNFDEPVVQESIEYFEKFYDSGLATMDKTYDFMTGFSKGEVPMFLLGPWGMSTLMNDYPELEGKWAVAPVPAGDTQTSPMNGSSWTVMEWSDQKDDAAAFINWMIQPENQIEFFQLASSLPSNLTAWEDPMFAEDPNLMVYYDQLQNATAIPVFQEFEQVSAAFIREVDEYYMDQKDINTTIQDIITETEAEMSN